MKFLLITIGTLCTVAAASAPNTSNTELKMNSAPRPAISKSRVTSSLGARAPLVSVLVPESSETGSSISKRTTKVRARAPVELSTPPMESDKMPDATKARVERASISRRQRTVLKGARKSRKHGEEAEITIDRPVNNAVPNVNQHRQVEHSNEAYTGGNGRKARTQRASSYERKRQSSKVLSSPQ